MTFHGFARRITVLTALFASLAATAALAQESRISLPSNKTFDQTVDAFKMAVSKGGMMVMSTVDQGNMLKMTGLNMKGTIVLKSFNNSSIDQTAGMLDQKLEMLTHMVAQ